MRRVTTRPPSFPEATPNVALNPQPGLRWQVTCGDAGHWRTGIYSPGEASAAAVAELEWHDCPELFLLLSGRVSLLLADGAALRELPLEPGKPVLVTAPHCGFCPDGPHTGTAFVVERDSFDTEYRLPREWLS
jgi:hypothetical protein